LKRLHLVQREKRGIVSDSLQMASVLQLSSILHYTTTTTRGGMCQANLILVWCALAFLVVMGCLVLHLPDFTGRVAHLENQALSLP
jgi:hypothetical protein